jgi:acetyl coenzyme A synthetase (ADP forming)-like protein
MTMLKDFFTPQSVAVIGAAREPGKLGYGVVSNILKYHYTGQVYPINPKAEQILGLPCYPSVLAVPGPVELAVIVVPNKLVPQVMEECGKKGVHAAIIISAGFREAGMDGIKLERQVLEIAAQYGVRIVGPNCLGIISTHTPLNASFAAGMPPQGGIAFMSQSGALCTAILDWALAKQIGFSYFVSLGNKADVNEVDLLQAWEDDKDSRVIIVYMEGLRDGRQFMEVARRVTRRTPVIAVKSGNTAAGSRAVSSHTGSLAGSERAYHAAFEQAGVLRADSIEQLFDYALAFAYQPPLKGRNVAIVTNAGGPGIMATDALESNGMKLATLQPETVELLRKGLPAAANVYNPVDVIGDALADRYEYALKAVLADKNVEGVLVILTPQVYTQIDETAEVIGRLAAGQDKPVLGCFMGEERVGPGIAILNKHRIPNYSFPERSVGALKAMADFWEQGQRPVPSYEEFSVDRNRVKRVFRRVRREGRLSLGDAEAREILEAYGLRIPRSVLAKTVDEAVQAANSIGYPVVMKVASPDILHKSDIGGVRLNVRDADQVRDLFDLLVFRAQRYMPEATIWGVLVQEMVARGKEVIIGVNRDPQFGPLLMFGLGGIYVEVLKDVTFRIAPVSRQEATEMMDEIRSYHLLQGVRGEKPSDLDAVVDAILRVSQLVTDFAEIVEMDINPLMVLEAGSGAIAVDSRFVLKEKEKAE